ncbi:MAG TPA: heme exporter protein CcmB [Povalibacter sp.]|uniref:heme exporter protein CcmB n=1 Tax=Povalibacter sp. TaxID=1962978 RepID=UPI002C4DAED8|nr:heme exporter protein CcmB [Povalibacter sp.]HMN47306.1 heme exporter protein CcmB [Povalibacter sp.]
MPTGALQLMGLVVRRDLRLAVRHWDQVIQPLVFFMIVTTLFPLAVSPSLDELRRIAPGVVWVAAMLASLLALESLFRPDVEDGTMEQWTLSGQPLSLMLLAKTLTHWVLAGLPIVVMAPLVGYSLGLPEQAWPVLIGSLALGTGALSVLGAIGAALTVSVRRGSVLLALLVLPLEVPILIFGARAVDLAMHGESAAGPLNLLAAALVLFVSLGPAAMAAAMRISVES